MENFLQNNNKIEQYSRLWLDFVKGDMSAFRQIYADFYPVLYRFGLLYLNKQDAENTIQDLFLYILQKRDRLKNVQNVKAYLITGYKHRIFKVLKSQNISLENLPVELELEVNDNIWTELFKKIIEKLTPREQEIVRLKYYQNYRNKEIATFLNIKYQTVRNILHNAITKMRWMMLEMEPGL